MKKLSVLVMLATFFGTLFYIISCSDNKNDVSVGKEKISYNFQVRPIFSDKCYKCHGPDARQRQAGLRLDIEADAYKALAEHPRAHAIIPGNPAASELYVRIHTTDTSILMPPPSSNLAALTEIEVNIIKKWIEQGAHYEPHWAFITPVKPSLPSIKNKSWPKNEIDYFVAKQLDKVALTANEEADKERLLKRISLDLTGLLPDAETMDVFLADASPNAYEKMVDDLIAKPSFGERMALPWLDVARFADSHGYQDDNYRSQWPWRDWVIHAFNENLPYDKFITWQLAGDLLPDGTREQLLATGFNRNHKITEEGGVINEEYRIEYVTDRTNTLGKAFMGVTLECAKCHDHKYDPFSQENYYQMFAFFNNISEVGLESTVGGPDTWAKNPRMRITQEDVNGILSFINKTDTNKLEVSVMKDRDTLRKTFILTRGVYDAPAKEVQPSTPPAILAFPAGLPRNRLGLAQWLFDPKHPLTSRVFVNRIWQEFFARGIVRSPDDFGMQGQLPSNPELLDWLAVDFREHGWNIKRLVKQIVMSATYRQSAVISKEKLQADKDDIYLSYAPRVRLQAELVRDMILKSSGLLDTRIGGTSIKPYQPTGLWEMATSGRGILSTYKQDHGKLLYRRGMYQFIKRTVPPPVMMIFDASNRDQCEVRRIRTNTPLQALVMMNDPTVLEASLVLADTLLKGKTSMEATIVNGFRRIICRTPDKKETELLVNYWKEQQAYFSAHTDTADKLIKVGEYQPDGKNTHQQLAALMLVLQVIYNMEEAITKT